MEPEEPVGKVVSEAEGRLVGAELAPGGSNNTLHNVEARVDGRMSSSNSLPQDFRPAQLVSDCCDLIYLLLTLPCKQTCAHYH